MQSCGRQRASSTVYNGGVSMRYAKASTFVAETAATYDTLLFPSSCLPNGPHRHARGTAHDNSLVNTPSKSTLSPGIISEGLKDWQVVDILGRLRRSSTR